jgi:hypothetical protein
VRLEIFAAAAIAAVVGVRCASSTAGSPKSSPPPAVPASPPTPAPPAEPPPTPARYLPAPAPPGSTPFAGGDGTSADQAVVVLAQTEDEGIDLEHHWIFDHYGRFRKKSGGLASADGKHFDMITVELGDHSEKTIYFDITAFYGVMEAPAPPPPR